MADSTQYEIIFAGQGGQGVRLASALLGRACASIGRQVASSASYGPEVRGSHTRSEVIISDAFIVYPRVLTPNILVAMSQEAYGRAAAEIPAAGWILYEADAVAPSPQVVARHAAVPALRLAAASGDAGSANMVMLGAVAALTGLVDLPMLKAVLPETRRAQNEAALERGFAAGQTLAQSGSA